MRSHGCMLHRNLESFDVAGGPILGGEPAVHGNV